MASVSINYILIPKIQKLAKLFKKPECKIFFDEVKGRHRHKLTDRNDHSERFPTFFNGEDISGHAELRLLSKSLKHKGIRAELHGVIEKYGNLKKTKSILNMNQDICGPEEVTKDKISLEFNFQNVKMPYESYKGDYASVRYFIKIIIISTVKNTEYEKEFAVVNPHNSSILQKNDEPIKMQVGMKNKLSLAIYFQHKNYNCRGTLKGFIAFNYLNINLKFMEVQIVRREVIFGDKKCEPAYVARYELIDGVPNKNEKIPIRFFLKSYNLTPTYPNIDNIFFVKYYLNLVIADDNDNRYFKQKEICLFRLFKEKRNVYNNNNQNNNYMNQYNDFEENDEIFITEPIYEEDFYIENKEFQNYDGEDDNNTNQNDEFYNDIKGMNPILPSNNNSIQDQKRDEYKQDNYDLLVMYMNNNFQNNGRENSEKNNYDDFENMNNNNRKNNKINNKNNNKFNNINNNNQFNKNKSNNNNYNRPKNNNINKAKNEIIINNNPSNYHSIKTNNSKNSYDENNMFEEGEQEDMDLTNQNTNNIINNNNNIDININYNNSNSNSKFNNYKNDFNKNENENNIKNEEDDMNKNEIENKKEVHHSHRSNLMQARISTEDDFNDILNSLDTNKKKDDLKKNIFG